MGYDHIYDPCDAAGLEQTPGVLSEVAGERVRQQRKWGEQNHPSGTGPGTLARFCERGRDAGEAQELCVTRFREGRGTYAHIFWEEMAEAFMEEDAGRLREELIQVAAVAVAWVECIDRRHERAGRP